MLNEQSVVSKVVILNDMKQVVKRFPDVTVTASKSFYIHMSRLSASWHQLFGN
jgi:hypothetical protein